MVVLQQKSEAQSLEVVSSVLRDYGCYGKYFF